MRVTYINRGLKYSIDSILLFQSGEQTPYWSDSLFCFYPEISKEEFKKRCPDERVRYLTEVLTGVYERILPELNEKTQKYNEHFLKYEDQINEAFSEAFEIDTRGIFNDLTGNICMNPVSPRFLKEHCFDVFYKNSEYGALGMSLHEMIHFVWFYVWNQLFKDSYDEYETPSLKWILSEMVVESIMSDERLSSINPYFPRERGGCVYSYFFDMTVGGRPVLDTLYELYKANHMADFMRLSYEYCREHEKEIREHMKIEELKETIAYCGVDCSVCADYLNKTCPSCRATEWQEDDICMPVRCCRDKGIEFCAFCDDFPCKSMAEFYEESAGHKKAYRLMLEIRSAY